MSEPRVGSWKWIIKRNKQNVRATWFVLKRYWLGSLLGIGGLLGAKFGGVEPAAADAGLFLGWFMTAMFVAHDISLGYLDVAGWGGDGE